MFSFIFVCIKNNYDYSHKLDIKIGSMSERGHLTEKILMWNIKNIGYSMDKMCTESLTAAA